MTDQAKDQTDSVDDLLGRARKEQKEFEQHALWRTLETTPQEFFKKVEVVLDRSGLNRAQLNQKLTKLRQTIETRVKEKRAERWPVDWSRLRGLKV